MTALSEHVAALMQFEAEERKVRLELDVEQPVPCVMGDETAISQVLLNIVVNALHAMPNGGLCRIAARAQDSDGKRWVALAVTDTGIGITKQELSRVFEPFYTTKPGGTGLGLAIAYRIMQDHGGTIQVSSAPGSGTTVVMTFPAAARQPQPISQPVSLAS